MTTIEQYLTEQQKKFPATGDFTSLIRRIALAGKVIANQVTHAALTGGLGDLGETNVQGEVVMRLDRFADEALCNIVGRSGKVAVMASEERADPIPPPDGVHPGKYVLLYDPLDGSSNIDYNVTVGTIFSIYKRLTKDGPGTLGDCLQPGKNIVCSGYIIYGPSTMMVYTTGDGVQGFTYDKGIGEFVLSHPDIRFPERPKFYSLNPTYENKWDCGTRRFAKFLKGEEPKDPKLTLRWVGSLVADFHRNLLAGGLFMYPAEHRKMILTGPTYPDKPKGKLRLLYEAAPLAFIAEAAGGAATDGRYRILDEAPKELHQRIPLFIGDKGLIDIAADYIARQKNDDEVRKNKLTHYEDAMRHILELSTIHENMAATWKQEAIDDFARRRLENVNMYSWNTLNWDEFNEPDRHEGREEDIAN